MIPSDKKKVNFKTEGKSNEIRFWNRYTLPDPIPLGEDSIPNVLTTAHQWERLPHPQLRLWNSFCKYFLIHFRDNHMGQFK